MGIAISTSIREHFKRKLNLEYAHGPIGRGHTHTDIKFLIYEKPESSVQELMLICTVLTCVLP